MPNPTLNENILHSNLELSLDEHPMTFSGTIVKTTVLALFMIATFAYNWSLILTGFADKAIMLSKLGFIGAIITVLFIIFAPKNKFLIISTSLYAMCEGLILGYISARMNSYYPGIASQAAIGTFFALLGMLVLYKSKIIKCTNKFRMIIFNSTLAVAGIYLLQIILSLFNITIPGIFSNSPIGIGFSIIIVAIASFNLIIDFDMIDRFNNKLPKYFEWYCGFSLLVTIIWMYIEILNLLMKLQSRNQ